MGKRRRASNRISPIFSLVLPNLEDEILVKGVGFVIPKSVKVKIDMSSIFCDLYVSSHVNISFISKYLIKDMPLNHASC
jgi:hypothetical protein